MLWFTFPGSSFFSLELLCFHTCSLEDFFLSSSGKIVSIFTLTEKPDFDFIDFLVSLYFVCHVCHTDSLRIYMISLIRFSMNIPLTSVKVHSTFAELLSYLIP